MNLSDVFEKYTVAEISQEIANLGYKIVVNDVLYSKGETKITEKQCKLIDKITNELGVVFEGGTISDASKFINQNLPFLNPITEKQKSFIGEICNTLDIEFNGTTKDEAKQFISKNIGKYNYKANSGSSFCGYGDSAFQREDYCGISPYDVYDEYDMPSPF